MCDFDGPDWMDIALAGALAEEIADEEKERERLRKELEEEQEKEEEDFDWLMETMIAEAATAWSWAASIFSHQEKQRNYEGENHLRKEVRWGKSSRSSVYFAGETKNSQQWMSPFLK
jgi:hypothetical protein